MLQQADREEIIRRLVYLQNELQDNNLYINTTWNEYQQDRRKRRELERWVENIVNCTIDISKVVLGSLNLPLPETYRDTLKNLDATNRFKKGLGKKMSEWAKLRNVLAHEYLYIRWESIKSFLKNVELLSGDFVKGINIFLEDDHMRKS